MNGRGITWRDYVAIALLSFAIIVYQIAITRILSVVLWYHWAFLTISLVMLGMGAPGVWFTLTNKPLRFLHPLLAFAAVWIPLSIVCILQYSSLGNIDLAILVLFPTFFSLGAAVCLLLIKAEGVFFARMYGFDLLGACLGAVVIIPLLHAMPTPQLAVMIAVCPLACIWLQSHRKTMTASIVYTFVALALLGFTMLSEWPLTVGQTKVYNEARAKPIYEKWTPTARLTIFDESFYLVQENSEGFLWGKGRNYKAPDRETGLWLEQDANAGTAIERWNRSLGDLDFLRFDITTLGYQVAPPKKAAIIGSGGGRDILSAIGSGCTDIAAIELNGYTVHAVNEVFGKVSGQVYSYPGVRAIVSEGRSFFTHSNDHYESIQISLIDSWAASTQGAYALAENNLYTVEAYHLYWKRLSADGYLAVSRWTSELPRLLVLTGEFLRRVGVADVADHVVVASAGEVATVLLFREPIKDKVRTSLQEISSLRGFDILYPSKSDSEETTVVKSSLEQGVSYFTNRGVHMQLPTDDRPFFFHSVSPFASVAEQKKNLGATGLSTNTDATWALQIAMGLVTALALVVFIPPIGAQVRKLRETESSAGDLLRGSVYFAAIGAGFMLIENNLLQRFVLFLGHPSYATTVILAGILLGMGIGSLLSNRIGLQRMQSSGGVVPVGLLILTIVLPSLSQAALGLPLTIRVALSTLLLVPVGIVLGVFFPLGMQRFGEGNKAWYWAVNGIFGVVASVFSLALSMEFGYQFVGLVSSGIYLLAYFAIRPTKTS